MKIAAIIMAAATLGLCVVGSTFASAQSVPVSAPPIQVLAVRYVPLDASNGSEDYYNYADGGLWITFKNVGSQTAKSVEFVVRDANGHRLGLVGRHGTFSPGVVITLNFGRVQEGRGAPAKASAITVRFVDGSSWSAP